MGLPWSVKSDRKSPALTNISVSQGIYASSKLHTPGVQFARICHPGLIGTDSVPPVAFASGAKGAEVGQELDDATQEKVYVEGAKTIPGSEHGGNCDIKNLSRRTTRPCIRKYVRY